MYRASLGRVGLAAFLIAFAVPRDAAACGGCFHPPPPPIMGTTMTVLNAHRMALSISAHETVLWDQIQYSGDPTDFVWVLPIAGSPTVEVADNGFFEALVSATTITLTAPPAICAADASASASGSVAAQQLVRGPVATLVGTAASIDTLGAIYESVVGPYEIVHIVGGDPMAMTNWLIAHGYEIPADAQPVLDAYASRGMGFVAARLQPGVGVDLMQPIRIRTPGVGLTLPLQMVAVGAGTTIDLELFVLAEGRMETANFPNREVDRGSLSYDYATDRFDYSALVEAALFSGTGTQTNWITDAAFAAPIASLAAYRSTSPGGDVHAAAADVSIVTANLAAPYLTHLVSRPARSELAADLTLRSSSGSDVPITIAASLFPHMLDCPDTGLGRVGVVMHPAPLARRGCACGVPTHSSPAGAAFALIALSLIAHATRRRI
jgi:hypothetical protein